MLKNKKFIIIFIVLLGLFVRVYKLYDIPHGINVDEAGMFVDANMLVKFGVDRYNNAFPVYLPNFGGGQSIMYAYLTALLIRIFSSSFLLIRVVSVIFGLIVIIFSYLISKEFVSDKQSIMVMAMVAFCPYFIQASRIGLDCNLLLGMFMISFYLFIQAIKSENKLFYFLSGICFGLCFYTYAIAYLFVPIFLFLSIAYLLKNNKINIKSVVIFSITFILTILPIVFFLLVNYGIIPEFRFLFFNINKIPRFRSNEVSLFYVFINFSVVLDLLSFDTIEYNALPLFGTIYYVFIPFFIYGFMLYTRKIYISIKNKEFDLENLVYFALLGCLSALMFVFAPNINKANAIFFPVIYFTVYGIFKIKKRFIKVILILLMINFVFFSIYYFYFYDDFDKVFFDDELYLIIHDNYELLKDKKILIYSSNIEDYIYEQLGKIQYIDSKDQIININSSNELDLDAVCFTDELNYLEYKKYFSHEILYKNYHILYN